MPQHHEEDTLPPYREDAPPSYSPTIHAYDIAEYKPELASPYHIDTARSWSFVILEINSTQLNIYTLTKGSSYISPFFNNKPKHSTFTLPTVRSSSHPTTSHKQLVSHLLQSPSSTLPHDIITPLKGKLLHSYTLQNARFGKACDYAKKENVLRLRLELDQFLLSFKNISNYVNWFDMLLCGTQLSLDIDQRRESHKTIPNDLANFYKQMNRVSPTLPRRNTLDLGREMTNRHRSGSNLTVKTLPVVLDSIREKNTLIAEDEISQEDFSLIYSWTCMRKLEAKHPWKGQITLTGDFESKKLAKFKLGKGEFANKIVVQPQDCKKFKDLVDNYKSSDISNFSSHISGLKTKRFFILEQGIIENIS